MVIEKWIFLEVIKKTANKWLAVFIYNENYHRFLIKYAAVLNNISGIYTMVSMSMNYKQ